MRSLESAKRTALDLRKPHESEGILLCSPKPPTPEEASGWQVPQRDTAGMAPLTEGQPACVQLSQGRRTKTSLPRTYIQVHESTDSDETASLKHLAADDSPQSEHQSFQVRQRQATFSCPHIPMHSDRRKAFMRFSSDHLQQNCLAVTHLPGPSIPGEHGLEACRTDESLNIISYSLKKTGQKTQSAYRKGRSCMQKEQDLECAEKTPRSRRDSYFSTSALFTSACSVILPRSQSD